MQKFLFIKIDKKYIKIDCAEIIYIEAVKNYVRIVMKGKKYILLACMHELEEMLSKTLFCRIHRSYIVSLERVSSFDANFLEIEDKKIPLSRQYKNVLQQRVVVIGNSRKTKMEGVEQ